MFLFLRKLIPTSRTLTCRSILEMTDLLKPPENVRGITVLDKNLFQKNLKISYLILTDCKLSTVVPVVKKFLLKLDNLKPIQHEVDTSVNILLNPHYIKNWADFPKETQEALRNFSITEANLKNRDVTLQYENFKAEDILKAVLPTDKEGMSSFTKTGHIVHVNLREHLLPYKKVIAEVLFDKVPGCRSVVNKTNSIDNTYRNFQMEVLKGDDDMLTTVKENNCVFKFDFSTVYWNSRLCTEHERIVKRLKANDVLFDVFAGVGPFAIPSAKKKCVVYANDLNPHSFKWLEYNAKANKIDEKFLKVFNKDGRNFIKNDFKELLPVHLANKQDVYLTMNLPALAVEFLDCFLGLFDENDLKEFTTPPIVFVYCFAKGENCEAVARDLVTQNFGFDMSDKILDVFKVRTVSSMKEMMRVTIRLDKDILLGRQASCKRKLEGDTENEAKKWHGDNGEEQEKNKQRV